MDTAGTVPKRSTWCWKAVLGGIGAVSLFVAAIGIANTMMMSICQAYEGIGISIKGPRIRHELQEHVPAAGIGFIGFMGGV